VYLAKAAPPCWCGGFISTSPIHQRGAKPVRVDRGATTCASRDAMPHRRWATFQPTRSTPRVAVISSAMFLREEIKKQPPRQVFDADWVHLRRVPHDQPDQPPTSRILGWSGSLSLGLGRHHGGRCRVHPEHRQHPRPAQESSTHGERGR
jgi:hypothetical protein